MADQSPITEEPFNAALEKSSYWAKRRLLKKMEKRVYRNSAARSPADLEAYVTNFIMVRLDQKETK